MQLSWGSPKKPCRLIRIIVIIHPNLIPNPATDGPPHFPSIFLNCFSLIFQHLLQKLKPQNLEEMQMLPKAIIYLGSEEGLKDENAIPQFTKQVGRLGRVYDVYGEYTQEKTADVLRI